MDARNVGVAAIQRSTAGAAAAAAAAATGDGHNMAPIQSARSRSRHWFLNKAGNYTWCNDLDYLSDGGTASVYRCREIKTGDFYALKVFKELNNSQQSVKEVELSRKLDHANIVRLIAQESYFDQISQKHRTALVLEYCPGGSLHDYLKQTENLLGLCDSDFLTLLFNMSHGLAYLREQKKVLHRDIKPGNILISWNSRHKPVFKLADFGSSKELDDGQEFQSLVGTYEFLHPSIYAEVVRRLHARNHPGAYQSHNQCATHKPECDLWSLGVTLYQAASGQLAFAPYGGVRQNHELMIKMMVEKPSGSICARQEAHNGPVVYSDRLPTECHLSECVREQLVTILQGIIESDFPQQWSFTKFFETVNNIERKQRTYYFIPGSMYKPDIVLCDKPTLDSLQRSLSELTKYKKEEMIIYYRSQAVTAFPTGTNATCPIIVMSMRHFNCSLGDKEMDLGYLQKQLPAVHAENLKEVKDFVDFAHKISIASEDLAKAAHLTHSLVLEAQQAAVCEFTRLHAEVEQLIGSKVAMFSSSEQKVSRLLELAVLVRAQVDNAPFAELVMQWRQELERVREDWGRVRLQLQDPGRAAPDRLLAAFAELFTELGQPALDGQCVSGAVQRARLVHERYEQIVAEFKRRQNIQQLVIDSFRFDHEQLRQCVIQLKDTVRSCCIETLFSVSNKFNEWLSTSYKTEMLKLSDLRAQLSTNVESKLDMLHDKICREAHSALQCHFRDSRSGRQNDLFTLNQAIQGLLESTSQVENELQKNDLILQQLDRLGLNNCGQSSSLESQALSDG